MTDSLENILGKYKTNEPPEIAAIKQFVSQRVDVVPSVAISPMIITIIMPSAASAGALRMCLHELQTQLETDKKLLIRIS